MTNEIKRISTGNSSIITNTVIILITHWSFSIFSESLKDVKTDSTLPTSFDNTIAKQLAAQREKRKLLWGKKEVIKMISGWLQACF